MSRRGRPRRQLRIRVRGDETQPPNYEKLARALLEYAAMQDRARREADAAKPEPDASSEAKEEIE